MEAMPRPALGMLMEPMLGRYGWDAAIWHPADLNNVCQIQQGSLADGLFSLHNHVTLRCFYGAKLAQNLNAGSLCTFRSCCMNTLSHSVIVGA